MNTNELKAKLDSFAKELDFSISITLRVIDLYNITMAETNWAKAQKEVARWEVGT